jgi:hypothetical protein
MKAWKKVLHEGDEGQNIEKKLGRRSFIRVMKAQTRKKSKKKVLHKGDEGPTRQKRKKKILLFKALLLIYSYVLGRGDFDTYCEKSLN